MSEEIPSSSYPTNRCDGQSRQTQTFDINATARRRNAFQPQVLSSYTHQMKRRSGGRLPAHACAGILLLLLVSTCPSHDRRAATTTTTCVAFSPRLPAPLPRRSRQRGLSEPSLQTVAFSRQKSVALSDSSTPSTASGTPKADAVQQHDGDDDEEEAKKRRRQERWDNIVKAGQDRAVANKKKREPTMDKKRRTLH